MPAITVPWVMGELFPRDRNFYAEQFFRRGIGLQCFRHAQEFLDAPPSRHPLLLLHLEMTSGPDPQDEGLRNLVDRFWNQNRFELLTNISLYTLQRSRAPPSPNAHTPILVTGVCDIDACFSHPHVRERLTSAGATGYINLLQGHYDRFIETVQRHLP